MADTADLELLKISPFLQDIQAKGISAETRASLDELWARVNAISTEEGVLKLSGTPSNDPGAIWIDGIATASVAPQTYEGVYPTIEEEIAALWLRINAISNSDGVLTLGTKASNEIGSIWIEES